MSNRGKSEINLLRYLRVSYRANLFNQSTRRDRRGVGTSGTCNLSDHGTPSVDSTFSAGRELIANGINGIVLGFCFFEPECKHELVFKAGRFPFDSSNLVNSILRWIFSWTMSHICANDDISLQLALQTDRKTSSCVTLVYTFFIGLSLRLRTYISKVTAHERIQHLYLLYRTYFSRCQQNLNLVRSLKS
jgi:hypothetical protein